MRRKINIGVIGFGQWGPNFVRVLSRLNAVRLAAICDADSQKRAAAKEAWKDVPVTGSYRDLLSDPSIDAAVVATPVSTHFAIVKDALRAGKHVLVEKPLSAKSSEAALLTRLAQANKLVLMVGHTFLYNVAVRRVKEIIKNKELGKIYYIHSRRTNLGPLRHDVNAIWDLSPHDISIINYLLDELPLDLTAIGWNFLAGGLADVGLVTLRYPHKVMAHIHVSWLDPKKTRSMTIVGSKKMLVYDDMDAREPIKIYDKKVMKKKYELPYRSFREFQLIVQDGAVSVPKIEPEEPLKLECEHFVDCLRQAKMPLSDGRQGEGVVRILESIDKSINAGGTQVKVGQ